MHNGNWHDGGGGNWWWIPMVIMMIAFWGGLAWVIVTLVRHNAHRPTGAALTPPSVTPTTPTVDPRQILSERLARGDIDIEDYRARLDALEHSPPRS